MSDKKNEDYVVRMPDSPRGGEKDPFMSRSPPRKPFNGASSTAGLNQSLSRLDNSPIISVVAYCLSSISMTIVNKYVVSGKGWNLSFFYLFIQVSTLVGRMLWSYTYSPFLSGSCINGNNYCVQATRVYQVFGAF